MQKVINTLKARKLTLEGGVRFKKTNLKTLKMEFEGEKKMMQEWIDEIQEIIQALKYIKDNKT